MRGARSLFISRVLISQMILVQHLFINSESVFFSYCFIWEPTNRERPIPKPNLQCRTKNPSQIIQIHNSTLYGAIFIFWPLLLKKWSRQDLLLNCRSSLTHHQVVVQSCPTLCDPMVCQVPLSMGFSRQEYWSSLASRKSRENDTSFHLSLT